MLRFPKLRLSKLPIEDPHPPLDRALSLFQTLNSWWVGLNLWSWWSRRPRSWMVGIRGGAGVIGATKPSHRNQEKSFDGWCSRLILCPRLSNIKGFLNPPHPPPKYIFSPPHLASQISRFRRLPNKATKPLVKVSFIPSLKGSQHQKIDCGDLSLKSLRWG